MAHQFLKPYSILSYLLALISGFFIGLAIAVFTEAAKGQMLAGGAIVFFYGLVGSAIALCIIIFLAYKTDREVIIGMNLFFLIAILCAFLYLWQNKEQRDLEHRPNQQTTEQQEYLISY